MRSRNTANPKTPCDLETLIRHSGFALQEAP